MKKLLLCSGVLLLCYASNAQTKTPTKAKTATTADASQDTKVGYSLCANVIAAKTIMMAGLRHNDVALVQVYMRDANGCALDARSVFAKCEDMLNKRLSKQEIDDLKGIIDFYVNTTSNPEAVAQWDDEKLAKMAVFSQLMDLKFVSVFNKLLA